MTALHRVKAYFGMVPADELDSYDGYGDYDDRRHVRERHDSYDRYESDRYGSDRYDRYGDRDRDRWSDRHDERWADREPEPLSRSRADDRDARDGRDTREPSELRTRTPRPRDPEPELEAAEQTSARPASRGRSWAQNTGPNHTSVRSGLSGPVRVSSGSGSSSTVSAPGPGSGSSSPAAPALAPVASASTPATAPVAAAPSGASAAPSTSSSSSSGPSAVTRGALAVDESRRPAAAAVPEPPADTPAPAEISSIQPQSYNEARVIGERYRDGIPVIMNLTEMDDASAKRLVDFAAGLAFALRGSIEKVTNRVFLLSPPNVEVSAAERRKFAENGFTTGS